MSAPVDELKNRLKKALAIRNLKPVDLVEKTKIPKSAISQYMSGYAKPKQDRIFLIAKALDINEAWLLGYDAPMERNTLQYNNKNFIDLTKYDNISPISTQKIPLLGEIACGEPIFANEDRESYVEVGTNIKADFCLRAKGDSMIGARILNGDIVFIKSQSMVENGEIAAVIINDEVTLKRVSYYRDKNTLILKAENPKYDDFVYIGEELNYITILGKAVAFQSDLN